MANTIIVSDSTEISSNVGYFYTLLFDRYVTISNVAETVVGSYTNLSVLQETNPTMNFYYESVPSITYSTSDGIPLTTSTTQTIQYWSTS